MSKNKYEDLNIIDLESVYDLAELFNEMVDCLNDEDVKKEYMCVDVFGKPKLIRELFETLIRDYNYGVGILNFVSDKYSDEEEYEDEYCLTTYDGKTVSVEKARMNDNKLYSIEDIALIYQEDCKQDLIDKALTSGANVTLFGFEKDEDNSCDNHCVNCVAKKFCLDAKHEEVAEKDTSTIIVNGKKITDEKEKREVEDEIFDEIKRLNRELFHMWGYFGFDI